jgi:DNA polymerase family B
MEMLVDKEIDKSKLLKIEPIFRKTTILSLKITKLVSQTSHIITICDSFAILPDSLERLAKKFQVDTLKGDFPHTFANEKTIHYIDNTPGFSYFENTNEDDYKSLYSDV